MNLAEVDMGTVYFVVGTLIVTNLGTIGTVIGFAIKLSFKAGEFFQKISKMQQDLNMLYKKINDIENKNGKQ